MRKLALALGLLLLVAPGAFAQYGGGSGTQTFTFPSLTIDPGPMTVSGTTTFTGPFLLSNGSESAPALAWADDVDGGWYRAADNDFRFSVNGAGDGGDMFRLRRVDANRYSAYWTNPLFTNFTEVATLSSGDAGAPGGLFNQFTVYEPDHPGFPPVAVVLQAKPGNTLVTIGAGSAGDVGRLTLIGDPTAAATHIEFQTTPSDLSTFLSYTQATSADKTITLPDLNGTVMLGGAVNAFGTTTETQVTVGVDSTSIRQVGNTISLNGDLDDDGDGTITALVNNDLRGIRIDNGGIDVVGDYLFLHSVLFATLGAEADGAMVYCSDCTKATPCAGAGTGAFAKRINSAWDCD